MLLVGEVAERTAILIDDLVDTSETITRAAKLLKKEGASKVYALITHAILSGDAIARINASALDKLIVTNSVPQEAHEHNCSKIEILDVGHVFAEVCSKVNVRLPVCSEFFSLTDETTFSGYPSCPSWREHQRLIPA